MLPSTYVVDCSWGEWTDYGACSEECGGESQTRIRVKTLESCGGEPCQDEDLDVMVIGCNSDPCPGKIIYLTLMLMIYTAVSSEAWAKLRDWAIVAGRGWLLLSGSVAHASLKTAVCTGS